MPSCRIISEKMGETTILIGVLLLLLLAGLALSLAGLSGCAGTSPEDPVPLPPGYLELKESLTGRSFAPLAGRRILLDPGHGGYFRGAIGPGGLTEAEVNLGVALYLRGLLEWAGATVHLTRTADFDFLSPADSSLVADLGFRISLMDSLQPDIFLSIHHNSNAAADPHLNETQTYYPLGDEGASLDLARAIHKHLVLNLEIKPAKILPGNFHVLRNATVPAVLGEPSMLSNPVMAGRLSLAASLDLEAQAYFLGLLDYFAAGTPAWSGAHMDTVQWTTLEPAGDLTWEFQAQGPGPAPTTFELLLNGQPEPFILAPDGHDVTWSFREGLPQHPFWLELRGRNLAGRAAPLRRTLVIPARTHHFTGRVTRESDESGYALVQWEPLGPQIGAPGRMLWGEDNDWAVTGTEPQRALVPLSSAVATDLPLLYQPADSSQPIFPVPTTVDTLAAPWQWRMPSLAADSQTTPLPAGKSWRIRLPQTNGQTGRPPLPAWDPVLPVLPGAPLWVEGAGILPLVDPAPGNQSTGRTVVSGERLWQVTPLVPQLWNKVVVLDPHGGGTVTDGTAPLGLRGSTLNRESALWAARFLRGAGARVFLTSSNEVPLADPEKVQLAQSVNADLFLTISRSQNWRDLQTWHYPGSRIGSELAENLAREAAGLALSSHPPLVQEGYQYLLRHTACPAVWLSLPGPTDAADESLAASPAYLQAEGRAILLAVAATFAGQPDSFQTIQLDEVLADLPPQAIAPPERDLVIWDGNWPWLPWPGNLDSGAEAIREISPASAYPDRESDCSKPPTSLSSSRGPGLPARGVSHTLELHAGSQWQLWLLEFSGPGIFQAEMLMSNPSPVHHGN